MTATAQDIVNDALSYLGVLAAGETLDAANATFCLTALNRQVDAYKGENLMIYTVTRTTWTITTGVQTYTMGTGGTINVDWPADIQHVNFQDTSQTPTLEIQLQPLDDDAWSKIPQRTLTSTLPTAWYTDGNYPLANVSLWPVPTSTTLQGCLYAGTPVTEFASLATSIILPPGYRRMLVMNLALELAPAFSATDNIQYIAQMAQESKASVKSMNSRPLDLSFDPAALIDTPTGGPRRWSILVGP